MTLLRAVAAASALPAAIAAAAALSSSTPSSSAGAGASSRLIVRPSLPYPPSLRLAPAAAGSPRRSPTAVHMSSSVTTELKPAENHAAALPDLLTEFMVNMTCEGCVSAVKSTLLKLDGINGVDVDISNQVVRVIGSLPVRNMLDALEQTGRKARLIGQGKPDDFLVSAAVAEFKGPVIYGVVRFAQVSMELARIESSFSGLSPGKHGWAIHEFGDLTEGAASTGKVFNPANEIAEKPLGDLGTLEALETREAQFIGAKANIRVADLIGRSVVIYETEDKSDIGIAAAVVARSAGVGENYKKICTCDGVTIWESS